MKKAQAWFCYYNAEIGLVRIIENGHAITEITLLKTPVEAGITRQLKLKDEVETQLLKIAAEQLRDYLAGNRQLFDLPLEPQGTEFQKSVWNALLAIPYGEIRSYKQMAQAIDNPKACRAVGMANNKNPILIVIPCHRVIGSDGSLVGYGGGLELKEKLLKLEGVKLNKKD